MKGKIVLVHFPFTDLTAAKLRPALVIHETLQDVIVAFVSSRVPTQLTGSDLSISEDSPAFSDTGLKVSSVIKFDKIATVSKDLVEGEIGEIPANLAQDCNAIMSHIFHL
ncbi:type II toxin-antitoxin system PemK/MazF family toxin [uncultured Methanoregula sp.]|uniref:type II toxin-antitoxin system PemK/MazF family toxin n=1 Tax=uncultured Methanoregula sp. TaxID=1005933 RepID=UPI002AAAA7C9|nr:type II toxin-antitoxin system PemK/MazF family toxin [uncultured Methanoregula sp.]